MQTIYFLPPDIISEIAAGEVIERPAYVIKELVENALDAQATSIQIELKEYGFSEIIVRDNGVGMNKVDISHCLQMHATSKTTKKEDLYHVRTLGFRGEALASISAVSMITIKSKSISQKQGYTVTSTYGHIQKETSVALAQGTIVIVKDIFARHPARKKFLKSKQTELRHCISWATALSMANEHVSFTLTHNNRELFHTTAIPKNNKDETLQKFRIESLLGKTIAQSLIPVSYEESYLRIYGFICHPQNTSHSSEKSLLFVNSRVVKSSLLATAIKDAFRTLIPGDQYPISILFIKLPYEYVMVNIDPKKEHVRFGDEPFVYAAVHHAISQTLSKHHITFEAQWEPAKTGKSLTKTLAAQIIKKSTLFKPALTNVIPVQLHKTYIVTQSQTGITVIDQHALHERIIFESVKKTFLYEKTTETVSLSPAVLFDLSLSDHSLLDEYAKTLTDLGFYFESFGTTSIKITHLPKLLADRNPKEIFRDMLSDLAATGNIKNIDTATHAMLTYISCRAAVKAGDSLSTETMQELVNNLAANPDMLTCPHGRPIQFHISLSQLETLFKRT